MLKPTLYLLVSAIGLTAATSVKAQTPSQNSATFEITIQKPITLVFDPPSPLLGRLGLDFNTAYLIAGSITYSKDEAKKAGKFCSFSTVGDIRTTFNISPQRLILNVIDTRQTAGNYASLVDKNNVAQLRIIVMRCEAAQPRQMNINGRVHHYQEFQPLELPMSPALLKEIMGDYIN